MSDSNMQPGAGQSGRRFFTWIRRTGIMRGDDRWIGGVCSGLAVRLGWNVTLVRALVAASVLFFGFGLAVYGIAWLLMPDVRGGSILVEDLINGHWDWSCLGGFVCLALCVLLPGAGLVMLALAAALLWWLAAGSIRQQRGYGFSSSQAGGQPFAPQAPDARGATGYATSASTVDPASAFGAGAVPPLRQSVPAGPMPDGADRSGYVAAQPGQPAVVYKAGGQSAGRFAGPSITPPAVQSAAQVPYTGYRAPIVPPKPRYARRKPAGPLLVLLTLGVILISGAAEAYLLYAQSDPYLTDIVRTGLIWICSVCVGLGMIIIVLGVRGRRSGGLIPISWIAGTAAVIMICAQLGVTHAAYEADRSAAGMSQMVVKPQGDEYVSRDGSFAGGMAEAKPGRIVDETDGNDGTIGYWTADASPASMQRLQGGIAFTGYGDDSYATTRANIDLTAYKRWHGDNQPCPTGTITVAANRTRVFVTLPDGCPYAFGSSDGAMASSIGIKSLGDRRAFVTNNYEGVNMGFGFSPDYVAGRNGNYSWLSQAYEGEIDEHDFLYINVVSAIEAKVSVQYASDSLIPTYVEQLNEQTKGSDVVDATMRDWHIGVAEGAAKASEQPETKTDDGQSTGQADEQTK